MCVSVEMWSRSCGRSFSFETEDGFRAEKSTRAQSSKKFNRQDLPLTSASLYTARFYRYDSIRSSAPKKNFCEHSKGPSSQAARRHSEREMKPKRTILCVDDNEQSLSIRKVLLETRGYRVVACTKGDEALELFKRGGVDLVLTDLIMPNFDGTRLIQEIKAISPQTPAILLSGKVRVYDRDNQADVFLPKGMYAPAELLERIRLLLVRKRGPKRAHDTAKSNSKSSAA